MFVGAHIRAWEQGRKVNLQRVETFFDVAGKIDYSPLQLDYLVGYVDELTSSLNPDIVYGWKDIR